MKPVLMELKGVLTKVLNSEGELRIKLLNGALELLTELEMDFRPIEKAIKLELKGQTEDVNNLVLDVLKEVDKEEYVKNDEDLLVNEGEDF